MRMFLTQFEKPVILRFATLELVRGEWRTYTDPLYNLQNPAPTVTGTLDVSTVNIEENGKLCNASRHQSSCRSGTAAVTPAK